jgi:hypothetical protein
MGGCVNTSRADFAEDPVVVRIRNVITVTIDDFAEDLVVVLIRKVITVTIDDFAEDLVVVRMGSHFRLFH